MKARMQNPAVVLPGAMQPMPAVLKAAKQGGVPEVTLELYFTDAERAALALAEAATRLADRPGPVPDAIWDDAADHYDERQLASLILWIGMTNLFNRLNATTRQVAGEASW
ncbi:carboxymuconolactone decarboxylase family protein [Streptomyces chattanoogensis]|uniref:carboxymuconolactone decarboxylase family protein n=1 Tax=Streptomyces chattanoogensis TaxID=66876 RepID=UPI0036C4DDB4